MVEFNCDIMERLKAAGWSEYRIRQDDILSTSTLKALRANSPYVSIRTIDRICEMLECQPGDILLHTKNHASPVVSSRIKAERQKRTKTFTERFWEEVELAKKNK